MNDKRQKSTKHINKKRIMKEMCQKCGKLTNHIITVRHLRGGGIDYKVKCISCSRLNKNDKHLVIEKISQRDMVVPLKNGRYQVIRGGKRLIVEIDTRGWYVTEM